MKHPHYCLDDLSTLEHKLLPSKKDVEKFKSIGWYVSPKIISDEIIDSAIIGSTEFYDGVRDFQLKSRAGIADDKPQAEQVLINNEFVTLQKRQLRDLGLNKLVVATAAILSETNELRLFSDSLINKQPQTEHDRGIVGWHTDKAYWPTCTSNHMLTAWIPLQDVSIEMGPVVYIDGSHKWFKDETLKQYYSFNKQELGDLEKYFQDASLEANESPMIVKRGQVCFHNCHVIHASKPNISKKSRLALAIHFQDHRNHYQTHLDQDGQPVSIGYDNLCSRDENDLPNYRDPSFFPVVFTTNSCALDKPEE